MKGRLTRWREGDGRRNQGKRFSQKFKARSWNPGLVKAPLLKRGYAAWLIHAEALGGGGGSSRSSQALVLAGKEGIHFCSCEPPPAPYTPRDSPREDQRGVSRRNGPWGGPARRGGPEGLTPLGHARLSPPNSKQPRPSFLPVPYPSQ